MPWGSFHGFLVGFLHDDKFYEFTSLNNSKLNIERKNKNIIAKLQNKKHSLTIETDATENAFILLHAPDNGGIMKPAVLENITSKVNVRLTENLTGKIIFEEIGENAGIEFGGKNSF